MSRSPVFAFAAALAVTTLQAPPAAAQAARTGLYKSAFDGWQVTVPSAWKYVVSEGSLVLGSDTEAGLITVEFTSGLTIAQMEATASQGIAEEGVMLSPMGAPKRTKIAGNPAVVADFSGQTVDGTPIRGRGVGIAGAQGGVVVLAITSPEKIGGLRKRVDQIARSVKLFKPKASAGSARLVGPMCSYSGGSVASTTRRMVFDGKGRVSFGAETVMGGTFQNEYGDQTGSWGGATGNQNEATSVGRYDVKGKVITIRWPGSVETCRVHNTGRGGRVTEMYCGDKIWAPSLCG
jgi:hypothetical protein